MFKLQFELSWREIKIPNYVLSITKNMQYVNTGSQTFAPQKIDTKLSFLMEKASQCYNTKFEQ